MRKFGLAVVLAGSALTLGGCATLNEDQCLTGDWVGIGYADGANGYTPERFEQHVKACAAHQVVPQRSPYMEGRQRGLPVYCTLERGFRAGREGQTYHGVCPAPLERPFLAGYTDGKVVWDAQQRLDRANSEISSAESRADEAIKRIRDEENRLVDPKMSDDDRRWIREHLKRLRDDRRQADADASDARYRRDDAEREVNDLRYRFGPTYGSW